MKLLSIAFLLFAALSSFAGPTEDKQDKPTTDPNQSLNEHSALPSARIAPHRHRFRPFGHVNLLLRDCLRDCFKAVERLCGAP